MMKKALVLSLVTVMVISAAACGNKTASNKDTDQGSVTAVVTVKTDRGDLANYYSSCLLPGEISLASNEGEANSGQTEKKPMQQEKQVTEPTAAEVKETESVELVKRADAPELAEVAEPAEVAEQVIKEEEESVPQPVTNTSKKQSVPNTGYNYRFKNSAQEAECRQIAADIAQMVESMTDDPWMQIAYLARFMNTTYVARVTYCYEGNYDNPYGIFVEGVGTCAGVTRATGMVLDALGIKWTHANPNQYKHQWNIVEINGEIGYCDSAMLGRSGKGNLVV